VPLVEQELLTLPQFTPVFSGVRVTRSLILCACFVDRCLPFCPFFLLAIVLSVLLVTQIFYSGQPSHDGDRKTFEVMTSTLPR
jgi:hypothetical protein